MKSCLFCKIVNGDASSDIIYENDALIVFKDIHPIAPVHVLIVPKKHFNHLIEMVTSEEGRAVLANVAEALPDIVRAAGLENRGFRLVNNCREEGGQTIAHVHFHLIGGRTLARELP
ncbi:MAG: HIT domain-containing protein [Clostridiaceae bacterium]|jgi:histidine triad (HIT) family protein|nr:HIT domain-containing protein [Clostridiaceae bacterium]